MNANTKQGESKMSKIKYRVVYCSGNTSDIVDRKSAYNIADNPPKDETPRFIEIYRQNSWGFYCWA